jgi:hypothetical protein
MYQVVAVGGGIDRQLLTSLPTKMRAKDYALNVNAYETEVVNDHTGLLVGRVDEHGTWHEQTKPARREIIIP